MADDDRNGAPGESPAPTPKPGTRWLTKYVAWRDAHSFIFVALAVLVGSLAVSYPMTIAVAVPVFLLAILLGRKIHSPQIAPMTTPERSNNNIPPSSSPDAVKIGETKVSRTLYRLLRWRRARLLVFLIAAAFASRELPVPISFFALAAVFLVVSMDREAPAAARSLCGLIALVFAVSGLETSCIWPKKLTNKAHIDDSVVLSAVLAIWLARDLWLSRRRDARNRNRPK